MAKARRLPSGSWRVQVFSHFEIKDGKKVRKYRSFTSKDKTRAGKKEAERKALEWSYERTRATESDSVYDMVKVYVESRNGLISPSTMLGYRSALEQHIADIGMMPVSDLDKDRIQLWISEMTRSLSPKTVHNVVGVFASAYKNRTGKTLNLTMPQKKKPDLHTPTEEELKILLKHVEGKELEIAIMLAAFCSLRRGEICALDYSDFKDGMVYVTRSAVQTSSAVVEIKSPKTPESIRAVPVPEILWEKVRGKKGKVISCTPDNLTNRFARAVKFSHLPHFRFHDLRHYYASMCHYLGVPDAYIMANGGWKTDSVMKRVYREALEDKRKSENDKVAKYLGETFV